MVFCAVVWFVGGLRCRALRAVFFFTGRAAFCVSVLIFATCTMLLHLGVDALAFPYPFQWSRFCRVFFCGVLLACFYVLIFRARFLWAFDRDSEVWASRFTGGT